MRERDGGRGAEAVPGGSSKLRIYTEPPRRDEGGLERWGGGTSEKRAAAGGGGGRRRPGGTWLTAPSAAIRITTCALSPLSAPCRAVPDSLDRPSIDCTRPVHSFAFICSAPAPRFSLGHMPTLPLSYGPVSAEGVHDMEVRGTTAGIDTERTCGDAIPQEGGEHGFTFT